MYVSVTLTHVFLRWVVMFTCPAEVHISQRIHTFLCLLQQIWSVLRHPAAVAERHHDRYHAGDAQPVHRRPHGVWTQHQTALLHRSESTYTHTQWPLLYKTEVPDRAWSIKSGSQEVTPQCCYMIKPVKSVWPLAHTLNCCLWCNVQGVVMNWPLKLKCSPHSWIFWSANLV